MPKSRRVFCWVVMLAAAIGTRGIALADGDFGKGEVLFALKVRPLLAEKCLACHGEKPKPNGGLDLASRAGMLAGGEVYGPAIKPGDSGASPMYQAVTRSDDGLLMPPKESDALTTQQAWAIRDWIDLGAPWPDERRVAAIVAAQSEGVTAPTSGGLSDDWTNRRYDPQSLWAYRPVRRPTIPDRGRRDLPAANAIDAFINRRLEALGLDPAPRADRLTLIRRASFDLLGLPPSPQEIDAFVADDRPDCEAFSSLVDRLLASPHYGERYGRHWLDLARYADTAGYANDYERPNAWRYRDYVVRAFNADMPFDEFVRDQIAGDEIAPDDPEKRLAVGFLRMGPWEQTGMSVAKVTRQQFLDDVTDTVGQVFLGHPLQCARCHDHKFDPIPARDYYSVQSVFATAQFADRPARFLPVENITSGLGERKYLLERIARYDAVLKGVTAKREAAARAWYAERGLAYAPSNLKFRKGAPADQVVPHNYGLTAEDLGLERIAKKSIARHRWELDRYEPVAFSIYSGSSRKFTSVDGPKPPPGDPLADGVVETTAILSGGDVFSPTIPVAPGGLSCVPLGGDRDELPTISSGVVGRRRSFADWVASPANPLTSRVIVNRLWQWHFGRGIVASPNNFGTRGEKPSHPELLDWLASEFLDSGWSIKSMHRLILNSEAYARSSLHPDSKALAAKDPKGASLARFRPRRLSAEEIRDAMLAASGELNRALGGVPCRPAMNLEAALQPRMIMGTYAPAYQPSPQADRRNRRTLYAMIVRGQRDPFLTVFDQPSPDETCEGRSASTAAPQALSLFNGREPADRSLALAARVLRETADRPSAVRLAFRLSTGREPHPDDIRACLDHWAAMTARHDRLHVEPVTFPAEVERKAVDENTGELFTFVETLEAYRDYVPDLQAADVDAETRALADVCLLLFNTNAFLYVD